MYVLEKLQVDQFIFYLYIFIITINILFLKSHN